MITANADGTVVRGSGCPSANESRTIPTPQTAEITAGNTAARSGLDSDNASIWSDATATPNAGERSSGSASSH
ncbi:hypothetical protein I317_02208 [Kwoniella heveanensis CBS 569]|nr:hypothetical protein I317_02208 [Kwoniella heveanensis CBS 569]